MGSDDAPDDDDDKKNGLHGMALLLGVLCLTLAIVFCFISMFLYWKYSRAPHNQHPWKLHEIARMTPEEREERGIELPATKRRGNSNSEEASLV